MSDIPHFLAIDFGSTHATMAHVAPTGGIHVLANAEGEDVTPLVAHFYDVDGVVVGTEAEKFFAFDTDHIVTDAFAHLGDPQWRFSVFGNKLSAQEIGALMMRKLVEDAQDITGETIEHVALTVPADFNSNQRQALTNIVELANLQLLRLVPAPLAASMSEGIGTLADDRTMVVIDLGGARLDVAVLQTQSHKLTTRATHADVGVGGEALRQVVLKMLASAYTERHGIDPLVDASTHQRLQDAARFGFHALSTREQVSLPVGKGSRQFKFELTQEAFTQAAGSLLGRISRAVAFALQKGGVKKGTDVQVVLSGGAIRSAAVRKVISNVIAIPDSLEQPQHKLVFGTALAACLRHDKTHPALAWKPFRPQSRPAGEPLPEATPPAEVTEPAAPEPSTARHHTATLGLADGGHGTDLQIDESIQRSLGLLVLGADRSERVVELIPEGTPTPARFEGRFVYAYDNMTSVRIEITEGSGTARSDVQVIGTVELNNLPPRPKGTPIHVNYLYDEDQRLHIELTDVETHASQQATIRFRGSLSRSEQQRAERRTRSFQLE